MYETLIWVLTRLIALLRHIQKYRMGAKEKPAELENLVDVVGPDNDSSGDSDYGFYVFLGGTN